MHGDEIIKPNHSHDEASEVCRQRGFLHAREVLSTVQCYGMHLHTQGLLKRSHTACRTNKEPIAKALGDPQPMALQVVYDPSFLRRRRGIESVEFVGREKLMIERRGRVLNLVKE